MSLFENALLSAGNVVNIKKSEENKSNNVVVDDAVVLAPLLLIISSVVSPTDCCSDPNSSWFVIPALLLSLSCYYFHSPPLDCQFQNSTLYQPVSDWSREKRPQTSKQNLSPKKKNPIPQEKKNTSSSLNQFLFYFSSYFFKIKINNKVSHLFL